MKIKNGMLSALVVAILLLQTYQLIRLDIHLETTNPSHFLQQLPSQPPEESFSACLMLMDDNAHLIEWLAYHYHALPLRRLIVAVDPSSQTSPSEILARWHGKMDITEWSDVDFMPPTHMDAHTKLQPHEHVEMTKLFRQRQEEFYARCMARLKYEHKTWVALVDTDEYILPNRNSHRYRTIIVQNAPPASQTVLQVMRKAQAEHEQFAKQIEDSPCLPMARVAFGVKESEPQEQISTTSSIDVVVPYGFDASNFQTLRWRWHAGRSQKKINKISKSILDVSRVDSSLFVPTQQVMVHLPIKDYCRGEDHLWALNANSLFVVHHYGGTWEQWSHRKDPRGKRTREAYDKMKYDKQTDDNIRPWLADFVNQVGYWTARDLLRGVGQIQDSFFGAAPKS
jgi:hypothetical protein